MSRFSKTSLLTALEIKISKMAVEYGFDAMKDSNQLMDKSPTTAILVAYGEFVAMQSLRKTIIACDIGRLSKAGFISILDLNVDELESKFGFDRNNGTSQLKGKLSGQDSAIAYGQFCSQITLAQGIDDGSFLR